MDQANKNKNHTTQRSWPDAVIEMKGVFIGWITSLFAVILFILLSLGVADRFTANSWHEKELRTCQLHRLIQNDIDCSKQEQYFFRETPAPLKNTSANTDLK